jgi:uncharacterized protein YjbI with pentapeptide repeats
MSTKAQSGKTVAKLKSITTFLNDAVEGLKNVPFTRAVAAASPWLQAVGGSIAAAVPPIKFALTLFEKLTAIPDPNELAELAFTLSYEHALAQAVEIVGEPRKLAGTAAEVRKRLRELEGAIPNNARDFSRISYDDLLLHPFVTWADSIVEEVLREVGYDDVQRRESLNELHPRFVTHFKTLISHGDTRTKFAPLRERLDAGTSEASSTAALLEHAQYQRALFEERPVFGKEVFALRHVYIDTECGVLPWGKIRDSSEPNARGLDPFQEQNGGRHRLAAKVIDLLSDPKFNDAIVIQGIAGSGKSAFTLWLAAELNRLGLRPIRILLRDVRLDRTRPVAEALSEAIRYDDESRRGMPSYPRPDDAFSGGAIFKERVRFGQATICPYVLILDGWDEISISVSEGFKVRLDRMLEQLRSEFLLPRDVRVRVVLTGRPSADVASSSFLRKATPVLTVRPLNPDDLQTFIERLSSCINTPPLPSAPGTNWPKFKTTNFDHVLTEYRKDFKNLVNRASEEQSRKTEVFGLPLLALLAVRLISEPGANPDEIIATPTILYRNLVDLTCGAGGKFVESDEPVEQQEQFRLIGGRLRDLLRRTAAALTIRGVENISYVELRLRLKDAIEDLVKTVERVTGDNVLSQLMISYFFKGGHEELGCEFLHKSFREYLFAEGIIETLKQYGRRAMTALPERTPYWKEFEISDPRYELSRSLASQLAPQWLSPELVSHLEELLEWEIGRTAGETDLAVPGAQTTIAVTLSEWIKVRDGLADVWDWWAEGVHLRPQPELSERLDTEFRKPYAQKLVEMSMPIDVPKGTIPEPPRMVVADAHLGDALFRLNVWTHFFCAKNDGWLAGNKTPAQLWAQATGIGTGPRRYQTKVGDSKVWILFAPYGNNPDYWRNYVARINAAGWRRPYGLFPTGCNLSGIDLRGACMGPAWPGIPCTWSFANLSDVIADFGYFAHHIFNHTLAIKATFSLAFCLRASFENCDLTGTSFMSLAAQSLRCVGCSLNGASFDRSSLERAAFVDTDFTDARFIGAKLSEATFDGCTFENTEFLGLTSVSGATFNRISGEPVGGTLLATKSTELPQSFSRVQVVLIE